MTAVLRALLVLMGVVMIVYGCSGCTPQPPKHPEPVQAPPPGYGRKVV